MGPEEICRVWGSVLHSYLGYCGLLPFIRQAGRPGWHWRYRVSRVSTRCEGTTQLCPQKGLEALRWDISPARFKPKAKASVVRHPARVSFLHAISILTFLSQTEILLWVSPGSASGCDFNSKTNF